LLAGEDEAGCAKKDCDPECGQQNPEDRHVAEAD
jgi:hypothetical protein